MAPWSDNPFLAREQSIRARSWNLPLTLSLYLCLIGGLALVLFSTVISAAPNRHPGPVDMARVAFLTTALQLVLVLLLVPPPAASSFAGEREGATLDLLLLGRLSPRAMAVDKLIAALAYVGLLLVAAVPVLLSVYLYAGLDLGQLAQAELLSVATAVSAAAVAMAVGVRATRAGTAILAAYGALAVLVIGTAAVGARATIDPSGGGVHLFLFVNPIYALDALTVGPLEGVPVGAHIGRLAQLLMARPGPPSSWGPVVQPWQAAVAAQVSVSALALGLVARSFRRPPAKEGGQG